MMSSVSNFYNTQTFHEYLETREDIPEYKTQLFSLLKVFLISLKFTSFFVSWGLISFSFVNSFQVTVQKSTNLSKWHGHSQMTGLTLQFIMLSLYNHFVDV